MHTKRRLFRALSRSLLVALSAACASGAAAGRGVEEERLFGDWESFFAYHAPRISVLGSCVLSIGRGQVSLRGNIPPVVEIDGHTYLEGCIPPEIRPDHVASVRILTASEASATHGSQAAGGVVRIRTKS